MATFENHIGKADNIYQAETMHIGSAPASPDELRSRIAELQKSLDRLSDVPETTRADVAKALEEAKAAPASDPAAREKVAGKLERARGLLQAVTGVAKDLGPLIGAIGTVIAATTGVVR